MVEGILEKLIGTCKRGNPFTKYTKTYNTNMEKKTKKYMYKT